MGKEKPLKASKYNEYYNVIRSDKNLRNELCKLSGSVLKNKLTETFKNINISGHFLRTVREILKENYETTSDKSNTDIISENDNVKDSSFNEVAFDKENDSIEYNKKQANLTKTIVDSNLIEKVKEFNDFNSSLPLIASNPLNKITGVIMDENKVKTLDEMYTEINTLKKEIENKNSDIELLKSQLVSTHEKIKSLSMANDEKQKEILNIQNSYATVADNCCTINLQHDMIRDLKSAYVKSKVINSDTLIVNNLDSSNYCVQKAIAEAIYIYGNKN